MCLVVFLSVASGGGSVFSMVFFWSVVSSAGAGVSIALTFPPFVVAPLSVVGIMAHVPLPPVLPFILLVISLPHLEVSLALLPLVIISPRPTWYDSGFSLARPQSNFISLCVVRVSLVPWPISAGLPLRPSFSLGCVRSLPVYFYSRRFCMDVTRVFTPALGTIPAASFLVIFASFFTVGCAVLLFLYLLVELVLDSYVDVSYGVVYVCFCAL